MTELRPPWSPRRRRTLTWLAGGAVVLGIAALLLPAQVGVPAAFLAALCGFLFVAALVLVGNFVPIEQVRSYTVALWLVFFLLIIADSIFLGRRIKKTVLERCPKQDHRMKGLVWYGISRATMVRRWRFPKPEVPLGAQV